MRLESERRSKKGKAKGDGKPRPCLRLTTRLFPDVESDARLILALRQIKKHGSMSAVVRQVLVSVLLEGGELAPAGAALSNSIPVAEMEKIRATISNDADDEKAAAPAAITPVPPPVPPAPPVVDKTTMPALQDEASPEHADILAGLANLFGEE